MNTDQLAAEFEQYLIRAFGVTWERSGIMHQFKSAIEKSTAWWNDEVSAAIDYLDGNDDRLGKSELHRKLREAFESTGKSRAARASEPTDQLAEETLARQFHETYERLAPAFHYDTRKESAKPWEQIPDTNKKLMIAVCAQIQDTFIKSAIEKATKELTLDHWRYCEQLRAARASERKFCSRCGYEVGDVICTHCGEPVTPAHASEPAQPAHTGDEIQFSRTAHTGDEIQFSRTAHVSEK